MPIYDYEGQLFELDTTDQNEALKKIEAHLGKNQKTSLTEDVKTGLAGMGKTVSDTAQLFLPSLLEMLPKDKIQQWNPKTKKYDWISKDELFKGVQERGTQVDTELSKWANPSDKEQGFGGKVVSTLTQLPALPLQSAQTGKMMSDAGEDVSTAQLGTLTDTAGTVAGLAAPAALGTTLLGKVGTGAAMGAAQDIATRQAIVSMSETEESKNIFKPTLETTALAGVMGGAIGGLSHIGSPKPEAKEPSPEIEHTPATRVMEETVYKQIPGKIEQINTELRRISDEADATRETATAEQLIKLADDYKAKQRELQQVEATKAELEQSLGIKPQETPEDIFADVKNKTEQVKTEVDSLLTKLKEVREEFNSLDPDTWQTANRRSFLSSLDKDLVASLKEAGIDAKSFGKTNRGFNPDLFDEQTGRPSFDDKQFARYETYNEIKAIASEIEDVITKEKGIENLDYAEGQRLVDDTLEDVLSSIARAYDLKQGVDGDIPLIKTRDNYIDVLEVPEKWQKQGLGTKLVQQIEKDIWNNGKDSSFILAKKDSIPFWEKQGYIKKADQNQDTVLMEKNLEEQFSADKINISEDLPSETTKKTDTQLDIERSEQKISDLEKIGGFTRLKNSRIQVDKGFDSKDVSMFKAFIDKLGLSKERIDIITDNSMSAQGRVYFIGNRIVIKINPTKIDSSLQKFIDNDETGKIKEYYDQLGSLENQSLFRKALVMSHELGHVMMAKMIQSYYTNPKDLQGLINHYRNWQKKHPQEAKGRAITHPEYMHEFINGNKFVEDLAQFKEFWAQQVAKELVYDYETRFKHEVVEGTEASGLARHTEYANRPKEYSTYMLSNSPLVRFIKGFKDALESIFDLFNFPKKNLFKPEGFGPPFNQIIKSIIKENEETMKQFGQTVFERHWINNQERLIGKSSSIQEAYNKYTNPKKYDSKSGKIIDNPDYIKGYRKDDSFFGAENLPYEPYKGSLIPQEVLMAERDATQKWGDIPHMSVKGLGAYFFGGIKDKGRLQFTQIYNNHPLIVAVNRHISNAHNLAIELSEKWLHGEVSQNQYASNRKHFITLDRIKTNDSISNVLNKIKDKDMYDVYEVFRKGFAEGLKYEDSLIKYGSSFSPEVKGYYNAFAKLFRSMYEDITENQRKLNKKNILPFREGWYPAQRTGDFYVSITKDGIEARRQHFISEAQAQRFFKYAEQDPTLRGFEISAVQKVKSVDSFNTITEFMEELIQHSYRSNDPMDADKLSAILDRMQIRGGKFTSGGAKHHEYRMNIPGYWGDELYMSPQESGRRAKQAIHDYINQASSYLQKEYIKTHTQDLLGVHNADRQVTKENLIKHEGIGENVVLAGHLLREHALNETTNYLQALEDPIMRSVDDAIAAGVNAYKKVVKKEKTPSWYPHVSAVRKFGGGASTGFYTWYLTSRPVFWLNQTITPLFVGRHLMREIGPLQAMGSMGAGLHMAHSKWTPEFQKFMYWATQNTHTIHPQFTMDLTKMPASEMLENTFIGKSMDWMTGYKESSMSDAYSRYVTAAIMFKHYEKQGLTGINLFEKVAEATDMTMVSYGRIDKAPVFQNFGFVGDMLSPLTSFNKATLGNLYADIAHLKRSGELKAISPLVYTTLVTTLLTGLSGVSFVAEYEFLRGMFVYLHNQMADDEDDWDFWKYSILDYLLQGDSFFDKSLDKGAIGAALNMDVMSGSRWQPVMNYNMMDENSKVSDIVLPYKFAKDFVTSFAIALNPNSTEQEKRQATLTLYPGAYDVVYDIVKGDALNREFVPDARGGALFPQTNERVVAMGLGTSTVEDRRTRQKMWQVTEETKQREKEIKKTKDRLREAIFVKPNRIQQQVLAKKLATKYGVQITDQELESWAIMHKIPAEERMKYGIGVIKGGQMSPKQYKTYRDFEEYDQ